MRLILDVPIMALTIAVFLHTHKYTSARLEETVIRPTREWIREWYHAHGKRPRHNKLRKELCLMSGVRTANEALSKVRVFNWRILRRKHEIRTDLNTLLKVASHGCRFLTKEQEQLFKEAVGTLETAAVELSPRDRNIDRTPTGVSR